MSEPLLQVRGLCRTFRSGGGLFRPARTVSAVSEVSFDLNKGEILGVVGESGSGKSTLARLVLHLLPPTGGEVLFRGRKLADLSAAGLRAERRHMQMVFQDPYSSLDPRQTVADVLLEPFQVQRITLTRAEKVEKVTRLLDMVALPPEFAMRYQHQLSGGQRQRVGIARALALEPALIVLDEPTASLDVSVQARVIRLLQSLRDRLDLTYVFISHDLALVDQFCDRTLVMHRGKVIEVLARGDEPQHPYTRALHDSVFIPDPTVPRRRRVAADF